MKVKLINKMGTKKLIADIASLCYGNDEAKNPEILFHKLKDLGHTSVYEHAVFTFKIEGVSRSLLAQLTRHRIASYTVESQRYIGYEDGFKFVTPESIKNHSNEDIKNKYYDFMSRALDLYNSLRTNGITKEDARYIFPNAVTCDLYMTINLRSLLNLFEQRRAKDAQWEIRDLADKIYYIVQDNLTLI